MEGVFGRVLFRHYLDEQGPAGEIALFDALVQVALVAFPVFADDRLGLFIGQVLDPLLGAEMKLDPVALVLGVDEAEGVAAETVHVAVGSGNAPVAHDDGDLVQRLGQRGPEVPVVLGAAQVGAGISLDGVVEVGEFERIAQEEDRRVVAHQVPVALLGVELHGKTPDVPLGVGSAALAGHRGKAQEKIGLLADFGKNLGLGVAGDVVGDGKGAIGAGTLGVHAAFGDYLPVEVGKFLQIPDILQQHRAARSGGHGVLVVDDGSAVPGW